jgi:UDP-glucose 4-epimerase
MRRVAVTGARGFIGHTVCEYLAEFGYDVIRVDRHGGGFDVLTADMAGLFDGCTAVIHLAGILGTAELFDRVHDAIDVNVHGTARVLDACAKIGAKYVGIAVPDCWPSVYQATKLAAVRLAEAYGNAHRMPVTHVRAFNVYGPRQAYGVDHPQKIIPTFASRSWAKKPMPIWGDGTQTVDLVHVDHVAGCLVRAAIDPDVPDGTYDAGSGQARTVLEVAEMVGMFTGSKTVEFLPMRPGELPHTDIKARFSPVFGFERFDAGKFATTVRAYQWTL